MKKIIAIIASVAIIISILNISSYADTSNGGSENGGGGSDGNRDTMTTQAYYAAQSYLIDKFCDGEITYNDFRDQSQAITDQYVTANTVGGVLQSGALNASNNIAAISEKIGATVDKWGDDARQRVSDWWNGLTQGVPTETVQTPTEDLNGYGVKVVIGPTYEGYEIWYGNHITLYNDKGYFYPQVRGDCLKLRYGFDKDTNSWFISDTSYDSPLNLSGEYYNYINSGFYKVTGDVRYQEDSPALPEYAVGTIENTKKNFDDMPAPDLDDILNDFAEELERQDPDLTTLEGLLKAIYARMGKLDSDNDNGLLSQINTSIQSLKATITSLFSNEDKKDDNIKDDDNTVIEKHEISGTLYNVIPLEKNWIQKITHDKTNLHVEYQGKEYYLESDGTLLLNGKYYNVDMNYSSTLDEILYTLLDIRDSLELLTEEEKQMSFSDFFDLKVNDFKLDLDTKFAFKDNLKEFIEKFFDVFNSSVPIYESGG